jgi:hypothetical protein
VAAAAPLPLDPALPAGLQPQVLERARAELLRRARRAGLMVVLGAHGALALVLSLAPAPEPGGAPAAAAGPGPSDDPDGCTAVISPACLGERRPQAQAPPPAPEAELPGARRCPEPLRRLLRREPAPPPEVLVDLLEAEIVERLGDPEGKLAAAPRPPPKPAAEAKARVAALDQLVKPAAKPLAKILAGGQQSEAKRQQLGKILGTKSGQRGGDGLVHRSGSAYVREVRIAMQQAFVLPGNVPPWLRAELRAKVRISRMTATGRVLAFDVLQRSGNDAFDATVRALLGGYKAGIRALPAPPPHVLEQINSRGLVVELRGG